MSKEKSLIALTFKFPFTLRVIAEPVLIRRN